MAPVATLLQQNNPNGSCLIELLGERLELLHQRAIYWPSQCALLVADLHWGKDEAFRVRGRSLPHGVLGSDLARLASCINSRPAERVYVLGDLIHNRDGMSEEVIQEVSKWRIQNPIEMQLIPGNHDRHFPDLPEKWDIEKTSASIRVGPFDLVHDPNETTENYTIGGHIHPLLSMHSRNDSITLPCFYFGKRYAILPAFSEFTGGKKIESKTDCKAFAIAPKQVIPATGC
ncbi:MAG: ligase-associated DNA damage response endonuclease PdeM [Verrucomicrobiota bacterium]